MEDHPQIRGALKRNRLMALLTRKVTWVDEDGKAETIKESWGATWAMYGVHSYKWWWVRRWGQLDCGCMRNPLTRRMIMFAWKCPQHGIRRDTDDN